MRETEDAIREEAGRVVLALADHPEFAADLRDTLGDVYPIATRVELDDWHPIGGADDAQTDPDSPEYRRTRRLGELKLALDQVRPRL